MRKGVFAAVLFASLWPVTAADAAWQKASSKHFIVFADDTPEHLKSFTDTLERYDGAIRALRGVPDNKTSDADRVRVYMLSDVGEIRRLRDNGSNVAGFYVSRPGGSFAFVPRYTQASTTDGFNMQTVLLHEYTHHFMYLNWPNGVFPSWFTEGFAEFHDTASVRPDGSVQIGRAPPFRARNMIDDGTMPAARLLGLMPGKLTAEQTFAFYARAWVLMHMLTFDKKRQGQLGAYINALNSGQHLEEASHVFGDLHALDADMDRYIRKGSGTLITIPAAEINVGPIELSQLSAGEAAVMPALIRSKAGVTAKTVQEVVQLARQLASPYPNDPGAQNELAEAEFDAGNLDQADSAADRALAADPKSMHALIYKGNVAVARLTKTSDHDPAHWQAARRWFVSANRVDPDNAEPLVLFYNSFKLGSQKPTVNAEDGLINAYHLAPYDTDLRLNAAAIMLRRGQKDGARMALVPLAYAAHGKGMSGAIAAAIEAIDAGDIAKALSILDEALAGAGGNPAT